MNDYMKLRETYTNSVQKAHDRALKKFFLQLGTLQNDICKHKKTQWLQEIDKDGELNEGLFKRCLNCNATLSSIKDDPEFIKKVLTDFDKACEEKKASLESQGIDKPNINSLSTDFQQNNKSKEVKQS